MWTPLDRAKFFPWRLTQHEEDLAMSKPSNHPSSDSQAVLDQFRTVVYLRDDLDYSQVETQAKREPRKRVFFVRVHMA